MRIGSYQVLLDLASGGMGKVYLARTLGPGGVERLVAIKRAHEHLLRSSEVIADRFLDEARTAAHVHHSNVVGVHQAGSDPEGYYLVLDYVEGESLNGLLRWAETRNQRLPAPVVLRIICDALAGLHAAHEAKDSQGRSLGILHRDVSTNNLLVGRDGVTRLTDFGIAKSALSRVVTDERYVQGKLAYMSPEYLRREPVGREMDVYAMGVTAWIALVGDFPWPGALEAQLLHSILVQGVPSLLRKAPELGPEIAGVIDRACHASPEIRYATAREMLDAVEGAARGMGGLARHVEVAEVVEAMVGPGLAERRNLIQQRRQALDAADESVDSAALSKNAPVASLNDGVARPHTDTDAPPDFAALSPKRERRSPVAIAVAVATVLSALALVALQNGARTNDSSPAQVAAPTSEPATGVQTSEPISPPLPPSVAPTADIPPTANSVSAKRRFSVRPAGTPRRTARPQHAPTTPQAAPFSSVNPYR
jgi:eukaryotic-like serine/threonine-protein kinase